ncbi:hypothetical protein OX283_005525 [Flavobacterium sp. SUN052]|uniref:hypothetical protein n=1 Tax=Flavobacterium sp. SUN052 TaxID=3002441 RepID=UPI00237DF041|nr:hypothetical protein [Flavobacterium sp. SUN052]MEC4004106.1 hypothetical protein [Flavobacterium sp. SUN052]
MKQTNNYYYFIFLLLFFNTTIIAQTQVDSIPIKKDTLKINAKKLKFGCGFGLNFVGGTSISLSPNLTYKISDKISFGSGIQGSYNSIKNIQSTTTFGANAQFIYNPSKSIQTLLEFVQLRVNTKSELNSISTANSYWNSALFLGLGYNINKKISIGAKYNFLYDKEKTVYSSAIIPFVNLVF